MVYRLCREALNTKNEFVQEVGKRGGLCIALYDLFEPSLPDMLVIMPGGVMAFVEFSNCFGERLSPRKEPLMRTLLGLDVRCFGVSPDRDWHIQLDDMSADKKKQKKGGVKNAQKTETPLRTSGMS